MNVIGKYHIDQNKKNQCIERVKSVLVIGKSYQTDQSEAHNQGEILGGARHQK